MLAADALGFSTLVLGVTLQAVLYASGQRTAFGMKEYVRLIVAYRSEKHQAAVRDLADARANDLRDAVRRTAHAARALKGAFEELSALDARWRAGDLELHRYRALRKAILDRISSLYTDNGLEEISGDRRDPQEIDVGNLARGAVGLHTALAARMWRDGHGDEVVEQIELAITYFPDLLATLDTGYVSLWCKTAGTLLMSSDEYGAAVRTYDRCLEWRPRDPWLLLGRGSTLESAIMLLAALPPNATLANLPRELSDRKRYLARAIADYEATASDLPEARIRLARLLLDGGDAAAALAELSRNRPPDLEPMLQYWRALVSGAAEDALGQPAAAVAHYRLALRLYPQAQTAAVALAHTLSERLGQRREAVDVLRRTINQSVTRTFASDPWWLYRLGQAWHARMWLEELHRQSRV
jgi:tetratricopeptide (TPR) repeat protein